MHKMTDFSFKWAGLDLLGLIITFCPRDVCEWSGYSRSDYPLLVFPQCWCSVTAPSGQSCCDAAPLVGTCVEGLVQVPHPHHTTPSFINVILCWWRSRERTVHSDGRNSVAQLTISSSLTRAVMNNQCQVSERLWLKCWGEEKLCVQYVCVETE